MDVISQTEIAFGIQLIVEKIYCLRDTSIAPLKVAKRSKWILQRKHCVVISFWDFLKRRGTLMKFFIVWSMIEEIDSLQENLQQSYRLNGITGLILDKFRI